MEKLEKLQMSTAWKLIAQFLSNLQCLLLIPIGVYMKNFLSSWISFKVTNFFLKLTR